MLEMAYGAETPLARAVRGRARRYADGLGMLVHQAAARSSWRWARAAAAAAVRAGALSPRLRGGEG